MAAGGCAGSEIQSPVAGGSFDTPLRGYSGQAKVGTREASEPSSERAIVGNRGQDPQSGDYVIIGYTKIPLPDTLFATTRAIDIDLRRR